MGILQENLSIPFCGCSKTGSEEYFSILRRSERICSWDRSFRWVQCLPGTGMWLKKGIYQHAPYRLSAVDRCLWQSLKVQT